MLERLTPAQLVEARAARLAVPLEDGWLQAGTIAADAHNDHVCYVAAKARRSYVPRSSLASPEDYIPELRFAAVAEVVVDQASIDAHQAAMEARYPLAKKSQP